MSGELISYMIDAITAHALFLSLGGLMSVNSIRVLAQTQRESLEVYLDAKARNVSIMDVIEE